MRLFDGGRKILNQSESPALAAEERPEPKKTSSEQGQELWRHALAWGFGFAPLVLMLITWSNHEQTNWLKVYMLPVAVAELVIVVAAFLNGMRIRLTKETAGLAALLLLAWITALLAPDVKRSILMTDAWTLHAMFGFAAARFFDPGLLTRSIVAGFVASTFALAVFAISAPPNTNWIGELPGLGNPRCFALYASVAIGLSIGMLPVRTWPTAIIALGFALIFWTGSRGAVYACTAGLVVSAIFFPSIRRLRVWFLFATGLAVGALIAKLVGSPESLVGVSRLADPGDNGRLSLWRDTWELILARPWFGWGEGQTDHFSDVPWTMHPHNVVLQILQAWGVIGLALTAWLGWWAARQLLRHPDEKSLPLIVAVVSLAAYSLIDGALYNVHTTALFAACLGVALKASADEPAPRLERSNS